MAFENDQKRTAFIGRTNTVGFVNGAFFIIGFVCFIVARVSINIGGGYLLYLVLSILYLVACFLTFFMAHRMKSIECGKPLKTDEGIKKAHHYFMVIGHKSILITSIIGLIMCVATLLFGRMWHDFVNDMNNNSTTLYDFDDEPKYKNEYDYVNATDISKGTEEEAYEIPSLAIFLFIYCLFNIGVVLLVNNFFFLKHLNPLMKVPIPVVVAGNTSQGGGAAGQPMLSGVQPSPNVSQPQVVIPGKAQTTVPSTQPIVYQQPAVQYVPQPGAYYPVQPGAQPGTFYPVQAGGVQPVGYYPMQQGQQPVMYVPPQTQGYPVQQQAPPPSYAVVPPIQYNNDQPSPAPSPTPPKPDADPKQE